jgi:hypothetical protein
LGVGSKERLLHQKKKKDSFAFDIGFAGALRDQSNKPPWVRDGSWAQNFRWRAHFDRRLDIQLLGPEHPKMGKAWGILTPFYIS